MKNIRLGLKNKLFSQKLIALFYAALGMTYVAVLVISVSLLYHTLTLAALIIATAMGFWYKKNWALKMGILLVLPSITMNIVSLYTSVGMYGLMPDLAMFLFNSVLVLHTFAFVALSFLLILTRNQFINS
jgi:hypothetical protein